MLEKNENKQKDAGVGSVTKNLFVTLNNFSFEVKRKARSLSLGQNVNTRLAKMGPGPEIMG